MLDLRRAPESKQAGDPPPPPLISADPQTGEKKAGF